MDRLSNEERKRKKAVSALLGREHTLCLSFTKRGLLLNAKKPRKSILRGPGRRVGVWANSHEVLSKLVVLPASIDDIAKIHTT